MVVLSAGIVSAGNKGAAGAGGGGSGSASATKTLMSRQFVEMTRLRVDGLYSAFPKLL